MKNRCGRVAVCALASSILIAGLFVAAPASAGNAAKLIDVEVIKTAPPLKGKPAGSANCSNDGPANGQYALVNWQVGSALAHFNPSTSPSYLGDQTAVMQSAFSSWSTAPAVNVVADGTSTKEGANRLNEVMFGRTGNSLATAYTWRWNDGLIESDVVFNSRHTWFNAAEEGDGCIETAGNRYDVRNIATHEFGHVYGLGHPAGDRFETMYAYGYSGETLKWSPANGDVAGIAANY